MRPIAPRRPQRLLDVVERLAPRRVPIAEINRLVGAEAERLGLPRPSYQRIRELVHEARSIRAARPTTAAVVADAVMRTRPPATLLDHLAEPPHRRLRDHASK